jgi:membrane carboxypeptidase/penicillin-binding protein
MTLAFTLLELANAYRMMASDVLAEPYIISTIEHSGGTVAYSHPVPCCASTEYGIGLSLIQEGLRGVVRIPSGTAHALDSRSFPIPVMGKTGTTNNYRDALFIGSTYGPDGITVAVRIGFDDNRSLGAKETGGTAALPVFREVMLKTYQAKLVGPVPSFPADMENNIQSYLSGEVAIKVAKRFLNSPYALVAEQESTRSCRIPGAALATNDCGSSPNLLPAVYRRKDERGRTVFSNE